MKHKFAQHFFKAVRSGILALLLIMPVTATVTLTPTPAQALTVHDPIGWAASAAQWAKDIAHMALEVAQWLLEKLQWVLENLQRAFAAVTNVIKDFINKVADDLRADAEEMNAAARERAQAEAEDQRRFTRPPNDPYCLNANMSRNGGGGPGGGPGTDGTPSNPSCERNPACGDNSLKGQNWRISFAARAGNWIPDMDIGKDAFRLLNGVAARDVNDPAWRLLSNYTKIFQMKDMCITRPTSGDRTAIFQAATGAAGGDAYRGLSNIHEKRFAAADILAARLKGGSASAPFSKTISPAAAAALDDIERKSAVQSVSLSAYRELMKEVTAPKVAENEEERKFMATWAFWRSVITSAKLDKSYPDLARFLTDPICPYAVDMIKMRYFESPHVQNTVYATFPPENRWPAVMQAYANTNQRIAKHAALVAEAGSAVVELGGTPNAPIEPTQKAQLDDAPYTPKQVAEMTGEPIKVVAARFKKLEQEKLQAIAANAKAKRDQAGNNQAVSAAENVDDEETASAPLGKQAKVNENLLQTLVETLAEPASAQTVSP